MPPELNNNFPTSTKHSNKSVVGIVLALLVILAIAYGLSKVNSINTNNKPTEDTSNITKEVVAFDPVDLSAAKTGAEKLPSGFPSSIPVETKEVTVSDTKIYTDRTPNVIVYTVNYKTSKTPAEKYAEYLTFMTKAGYIFDERGKDDKNHVLYGKIGSSSLLVVSSLTDGQNVVQIAYTTNR